MSLSLPIPTYNGGISTDILLEEVTAPYRDAMTQSYQVKNSLSLDRPPVRKNQMSARHQDFYLYFIHLKSLQRPLKRSSLLLPMARLCLVVTDSDQCDQIWRNFATLAQCEKTLAILKW